jgi:hypothetical protein
MTLISIIGFFVICLTALYFTIVSTFWIWFCSAFDEGIIPPLITAVITIGLWILAYNVSPFTVLVNLA